MDKNRTDGAAQQLKGNVKEGVGTAQQKVGEMLGDAGMQAKGLQKQAEGGLDKLAGKAQNAYGNMKDEARASKEESRERKVSGR